MHPLLSTLFLCAICTVSLSGQEVASGSNLAASAAAAASASPPLRRYVPEACCQSLLSLVGESGDERVVQIAEHGRFTYLLSNLFSSSDNNTYGLFTKLDEWGRVVWRKQSESNMIFSSFARLTDGFVVTGGVLPPPPQTLGDPSSGSGASTSTGGFTSYGFEADAGTLYKIGFDGSTTWTKRYNYPGFEHLAATTDGKAAYFLSRRLNVNSYGDAIPLLLKVTSAGIVSAVGELERTVTDATSSGSFQAIDLFVDELGQIVVFGNIRGTEGASIFLLNSNGSLSAHYRYSGDAHSFERVAQTSDGRYIVLGHGSTSQGDRLPRIWLFTKDNNTVTLQGSHKIDAPGTIARFDAVTTEVLSTNVVAYFTGSTTQGKSFLGKTVAFYRSPAWEFAFSATEVKSASGVSVSGSVVAPSADKNHLVYANSRLSDGSVELQTLVGGISKRFDQDCLIQSNWQNSAGTDHTIYLQSEGASIPTFTLTSPIQAVLQEAQAFSEGDCLPDIIDGCIQSFPIPTHGYFSIPRPSGCDDAEAVTVTVRNQTGQLVGQPQTFAAYQVITLDLSNQQRGMLYYVELRSDNGDLLQVASIQLT
ncbi:hypothetical protein GGR28_000572 [Lewinella aquimaris]|uniref:Uncharacterized protein n=1 Tax=Neolewinella aquimaris TaxID=1835722 RepID=A0A840DYB3_9BACT|nr:hypothetical protein [Neolewinella aquimaris]MBB4077971.1 hypothetical protein [Neolewinella aquimaris]